MIEFLGMLLETTMFVVGVTAVVLFGVSLVALWAYLTERHPVIGIIVAFAVVVLLVTSARYLGG